MLARFDVLLLNDFLIRSLSDDQAADLLEVVDDRTAKSTIVTSQLPVDHWHEGLSDPTVADATSTVCWSGHIALNSRVNHVAASRQRRLLSAATTSNFTRYL